MPERGPGLRDGGHHHARRRQPRPDRGGRRTGSTRSSRRSPGVGDRTQITGYSLLDGGFKTNAGTFFVTLKPFDERYALGEEGEGGERPGRADGGLREEAGDIQEGLVIPIAAARDPRHRDDRRLRVLDPGHGRREIRRGWTSSPSSSSRKARQRPELTGAEHAPSAPRRQQLRADVDRDKANLLGVPVQDVYSAIQAQFGSLTVSQFNEYSRVWWVVLQSDAEVPAEPRRPHPPLHALVSRRDGAALGAGDDPVGDRPRPAAPFQRLPGGQGERERGRRATAPARRSRRWRRWRGRCCPPGYTFAWSGLAFEEKKSGGTSALAFVFGLVIVFLVLAAQYESWTLPGRGHDGGALRHPRRPDLPTGCGASRTTSTSRSAFSS